MKFLKLFKKKNDIRNFDFDAKKINKLLKDCNNKLNKLIESLELLINEYNKLLDSNIPNELKLKIRYLILQYERILDSYDIKQVDKVNKE